MDRLYLEADFSSASFRAVQTSAPGDGGIVPGGLVFAEHLEARAGKSFSAILQTLVGDRPPDARNLGGPAIVALIGAAQLLHGRGIRAHMYAARGDDRTGEEIGALIGRTPVSTERLVTLRGASPSTIVLSDPRHHGGKGERSFINVLGAAGSFTPDHLAKDFFDADLLVFGATALVPGIHDALDDLLREGRRRGRINVVCTVYDFRNQQRAPDRPWPLGRGRESYPLMDLLVADREEALRISGEPTLEAALRHFLEGGVGAVVVTHGAKPLHCAARKGLFRALQPTALPVCAAVDEVLARPDRPKGDTTGCGDNFVGGVLASMVEQRMDGQAALDLVEACAWGSACGGFACFYPGGTYFERAPGEKRAKVAPYHSAYLRQIGRRP